MRKRQIPIWTVIILLLITMLLITACGANEVTANEIDTSTNTEVSTLVLGDISDDPIKKIERFQPLADYLASNLVADSTIVGKVKIAPNLETMVEWMETGEVDLYFDSLYGAMHTNDQAGAEPILRGWKGGDAEYYSVFFVRADSDITSLEDMKGKTMAFEEPFSTSGYMLPYATLLQAGFKLTQIDKPESDVNAGHIGYLFSSDDHNTIQWVISGRVAVGVVDNQTLAEIPEENQDSIRIVTQTNPIPRQVVMASRHLEATTVEQITQLLLDLDETEEGLEILDRLKTAQFDEFPEGANQALSEMQELYQLTIAK